MERTITVKGVGSVSAKPDYVVLLLSIDAEDKEYEKALEDAAGKIDLLESAARRMGFEKGALKTVSFNVNTQYENAKDRNGDLRRVFAGYLCSTRLKRACDLDSKRLAAVLTAIAAGGADPELHISFTVKDPAKVSEELLSSASANAREKAQILCRASGVELGKLVRIDYNWNELNIISPTSYGMEQRIMPMMAESRSVPEIEPEDIDLRDTATFVWEIG